MRNKLKGFIFAACTALFCFQTSAALANQPVCPPVEQVRAVKFTKGERGLFGMNGWQFVETISYNSHLWNVWFFSDVDVETQDEALIKGQELYARLASQMTDHEDCAYFADGKQLVFADSNAGHSLLKH